MATTLFFLRFYHFIVKYDRYNPNDEVKGNDIGRNNTMPVI